VTVEYPPPHPLPPKKKNIRAGELDPEKKSCRGSGREKKFLQAEEVPPPLQFSNGPSLISGEGLYPK